MENPYTLGRDCVYAILDTEANYNQGAWQDVQGLSVDVNYPGRKFIICSICISTTSHVNAGFRLVDADGKAFPPMRSKADNREPVHFSFEPSTKSSENLSVVTFHMIAEVKKKVQLQIRADDAGTIRVNGFDSKIDKPYNHKTISILSVISL